MLLPLLFLLASASVSIAAAPELPNTPPLPEPFQSATSAEEPDELVTGRENCFLTVLVQYRSKKTEEIRHAFEADSRDDCAERRDLFAQNFSPAEVLTKKVTMKWVRE